MWDGQSLREESEKPDAVEVCGAADGHGIFLLYDAVVIACDLPTVL